MKVGVLTFVTPSVGSAESVARLSVGGERPLAVFAVGSGESSAALESAVSATVARLVPVVSVGPLVFVPPSDPAAVAGRGASEEIAASTGALAEPTGDEASTPGTSGATTSVTPTTGSANAGGELAVVLAGIDSTGSGKLGALACTSGAGGGASSEAIGPSPGLVIGASEEVLARKRTRPPLEDVAAADQPSSA
jgi:hypothetical protein